jgi:chromosome segregation ATPase
MAEDFDAEDELEESGDYAAEEEQDPYVEISELRQKLNLLQKTKEAQRARYKKEMQVIVQALLSKHRELQKENHFLQQQLNQMMGETGDQEDFLSDLKDSIAEQKKEVAVLRKLVHQYEGQSNEHQQEVAELDTLRDMIDEKDQFIRDLEDKNQEFLYQLEAKDGIISRISTKVANLEADVYAAQKRMRASGGAETGEYLDELNALKQKLAELEEKKNHYEKLARQAYEERQAAKAEATTAAAHAGEAAAADNSGEAQYEEAMDMLLEELQENLSTYDEISSQFSKARA